jgi:hypothetical protein
MKKIKAKNITFMPKTGFVHAYAPLPEPMSKNIPQWWRNQGVYIDDKKEIADGGYSQTVKKCPGILDLMVTGYMLKFPCDVEVDATGDHVVFNVHPVHQNTFSSHSRKQFPEWNFDRDRYLEDAFRIHPMWVVSTSKGYSTLFVEPYFHENLPFRVVPAIVDTDTYLSDGWFSVLVEKGFKGVIEKGTPLVQCIPYKRDSFKMEILDKPDRHKLAAVTHSIRSKFTGGYKSLLWHKKEYK